MPDFDLVVIGSGPAGYAAALRGAELGGRIAVVESETVGGNCLRYNCIPSNILLDTARAAIDLQELALMGVVPAGSASLSRAVARQGRIVSATAEGMANLLQFRGIQVTHGRGRLASPTAVTVELSEGGETSLSAGAIVIAGGARPQPPVLPGLDADGVLTSDQALALPEPPGSLLVLGGGPIGLAFVLEYAFLFAAFGSSVTVVEAGAHVLPEEDADLTAYLVQALEAAGVRVLAGSRVAGIDRKNGVQQASVETPAGPVTVDAELIVAPDCRAPFVEGLGAEAAGLPVVDGALSVDEHCRTAVSTIFAVGDVTGGLRLSSGRSVMLSHTGAHQGRVAAENALGQSSRVDLRVVPRCIHTQPELASVGLTEEAARAQGHSVVVGLCDLATNARAVALGRGEGVVKVVAGARHGEILGVHILGPQASEVIGQAVLAMRLEATLDDLAAAVHWHPSLAEALTDAARQALAASSRS